MGSFLHPMESPDPQQALWYLQRAEMNPTMDSPVGTISLAGIL